MRQAVDADVFIFFININNQIDVGCFYSVGFSLGFALCVSSVYCYKIFIDRKSVFYAFISKQFEIDIEVAVCIGASFSECNLFFGVVIIGEPPETIWEISASFDCIIIINIIEAESCVCFYRTV